MNHAPAPAFVLLAALFLAPACAPRTTPAIDARPASEPGLARQVEVIRTEYGVPHIYADTLRALGYALGYLQVEDYGARVPLGLLGARGELARYEGRRALDSDFASRPAYLRAVATYRGLAQDTRDVYEGFAAGVNRYIERHPDEFPAWMGPAFTGYDVAALYVYQPSPRLVREWTQRLREADRAPLLDLADPAGLPTPHPARAPAPDEDGHIEEGSSAWALAPGRTTSNAAILLRNPHLDWTAGYWEAHAVVPGRLDFYGDFRIGGPLGIIGGFNRHLGFATTNNQVNSAEVYALDVDPQRPDHYRFDGASVPIRRERLTRPFRNGDGSSLETRERLSTHLGPVLHRDHGRIYVLRAAEDGEFRGGEQFLRLIQATSLEQWMEAMRLRAHPRSNFIYADAEGNIFYIWNAAMPVRPHPSGGGTLAVPAARTEEVWTEIYDLDALPQLLNPPGGYVRNENDGPWFTNLRQPLDPAAYPADIEGNAFALRSQHSTLLLDSAGRISLEDVVRLKHTYRMLLADRLKDDLIAAARAAPDGVTLTGGARTDDADTAAGLALLERWDNTAAPESRGAVLFAEWWRLYSQALGAGDDASRPFAVAWTEDAPLDTPRGLADPALAARLFPVAMRETAGRFGSWDVAWGDVHRVRRGDVDEPVGGCSGALGCFRVLNFQDDTDGRRIVSGGDGWVLAVEFTDPPRAYSVLGYGQSAREDSPHYADQAMLFARGEMKPVAYTQEDVKRRALRRYRPGLE
jgi:acyl-homoserine-lactone acylase